MIKSRRMRWSGHVACLAEMRNAHKNLAGKLEKKRPLRSPRHRWEDNVRMKLKEIGKDGVDWIFLA
jgi:hypothetical protein